MTEWCLLLLAERTDGPFALESAAEVLRRRAPVGLTDCRSVRDHLISLGSGGVFDDKRIAIDIAIMRQSIARCGLEPRWCPTGHMVADGLTKDKADRQDFLRSVTRNAKYQLAHEDAVLDRAKAEKLRRQQVAAKRARASKAPTDGA